MGFLINESISFVDESGLRSIDSFSRWHKKTGRGFLHPRKKWGNSLRLWLYYLHLKKPKTPNSPVKTVANFIYHPNPTFSPVPVHNSQFYHLSKHGLRRSCIRCPAIRQSASTGGLALLGLGGVAETARRMKENGEL
eukprot:g28862.t1